MKNIIFLLLLVLSIASCNKADQSNIVGNWKMTRMTIGDTDAPAYFIYEIYYQLDAGGTGLYKEDTYTDTLTWSLDETNQKLYLMKSSGNLEFKIKSVTNTTLIMTGQESGVGEIEVEFEKQ